MHPDHRIAREPGRNTVAARTLWFLALLSVTTVAFAAAPTDFTVSAGDKTFRLSDAKGRFVALHFLLKTECPYCQRYVGEMSRRAPEVAGVVHVFLKPDSEDEIKRWSAMLEKAGVTATIYRDADAKLADAFEVPGGYAFHGETVHYPALILLGLDGQVVYRYIGKNNTDRMPFEQFAANVAQVSKSPAIGEYNLAEGALALGGYDPVAYVVDGKAQKGREDLTSQYRSVTYRFSSAAHRQQFAANPDPYVPAYGGWCATAMADGRKVEIDPANFKVTNGRLLLFYKGWRGDALKAWNKDEQNLTVKADAAWHKLAPAEAVEKK